LLKFLHHITVLEHDIMAILSVPESVVILVIIRTPWEWYDDFSLFEEVDLSETRRTATSDDEISLGQYRSECMSIDPVVECDVLEAMEEGTFLLVQESEKYDPLDIERTTCLCYCTEYVARSLTSTDDEDVIFGSFPVTIVLRWFQDLRVYELPDDCTLGIPEVLARDIESQEYALSQESKEDIGLAWNRIRLVYPERYS
jgi:uncharacterized protein YuzB (UPF0349 family)